MPIYAKMEMLETLLPGVLCCATIAAVAQFLSEHYSGPQMLFALLLGLAFHFLAKDRARACLV